MLHQILVGSNYVVEMQNLDVVITNCHNSCLEFKQPHGFMFGFCSQMHHSHPYFDDHVYPLSAFWLHYMELQTWCRTLKTVCWIIEQFAYQYIVKNFKFGLILT